MAAIGGPCWSGQTKQLPLELVERIGQYLDGVSLIRMAATDSFMRKAAHHVAVLRLDSLAKEHPGLGDSLAKMGWTKTAASKLSLADFRFFHLVVICVWNSFGLHSKTVIDHAIRLVTSRNGILAVARGSGEREKIILESINQETLERRVVMTKESGRYLQIANFENTLVACSQYRLSIWNSASLARVGEIDLINQKVNHKWKETKGDTSVGKIYSDLDLKDEEKLKNLEIGEIVVVENAIVVQWIWRVDGFAETWIYKINTNDPKLKDLVLEKVFRKSNDLEQWHVTVNNCYLGRIEEREMKDGYVVQFFNRKSPPSGPDNEEGVKFDVEVRGANPNFPIKVIEAKFCQGRESPLIALIMGIDVANETPMHRGRARIVLSTRYRVMMQVLNIETREVLVQHNFGVEKLPRGQEVNWMKMKMKMCWFGSHLLVAYMRIHKRYFDFDEKVYLESGELSLFCWQEGAVDILPTAISFQLDKYPKMLVEMSGNLQEIIIVMRDEDEDDPNVGSHEHFIYKCEHKF